MTKIGPFFLLKYSGAFSLKYSGLSSVANWKYSNPTLAKVPFYIITELTKNKEKSSI